MVMMRDFLTQRLLRGLVRRFNNLRIRAMARHVAAHQPPAAGDPVIFFKASTGIDDLSWNSGFHLLASWALRLAGVPVLYFACDAGMSHCVLGTNRDHPRKAPPCRSCVYQSRTLYARSDVAWFHFERDPRLEQALQGLDLGALARFEWIFPGQPANGGARAVTTDLHSDSSRDRQNPRFLPLGRLCLPSLRWILRVHHLNDDESTRYLLREYILSAWNVARTFAGLLDRMRPRAVVVFNGQFFPEATARFLAQQRGVRVITHEVGLQPASAFFTDGEATAYPLNIPEAFELDPAQEARLDAYLQERFRGEFSMAGIRFWPRMQALGPEFLATAARFGQLVAIFTNVVFDTSQPHANTVFEDMFEWLDRILGVIRANPETLFVIRAHPDELRLRKSSRETVAAWMRSSGADTLPNLYFIGPQERLSSYDLISKSKFVMVYNSTVGLEASLMGVPVLCSARARYTQYPTVFFPQSKDHVLGKLQEFLEAEKIYVPAEFRHNARRFLYYQLFRASLPFDAYLRPSVRSTQTRLKAFGLRLLSPHASPALRAILHGVLADGDFVLDDAQAGIA